MTTRKSSRGQLHSRVPSSTSSTSSNTASSYVSTMANSEISYNVSAETIVAANGDGSQEEPTMTPARIDDRQSSIDVVFAQTHQSLSTSYSHQVSNVAGSWPLCQQILQLDRIESEEKAATEAEKRARGNGDFLLKLLDAKGFDRDFVKELRTVINMVRHMNIMLFKDKNDAMDWKIRPEVLEMLEEVTIQVFHYFNQLGNGLNRAIEKIIDVKPHLPNIGPGAYPWDLKTKLHIWNARLMKYVEPADMRNRLRGAKISYSALVAPVRKREKQLFDGFTEFYYAMIFYSFLQVRKINPEHDMCKFSAEFTAIYDGLNFLNDAYATIDRETHKLGAIYGAARDRLLSTAKVFDDQFHKQVELDVVVARNARATQTCADTTNAATLMRGSSASTLDSFNSVTKTNTAVRSAMATTTKEEEAEEERQFQAAIVILMKEKLEREASLANVAAEARKAATAKKTVEAEAIGESKATVTDMSKDGGKPGPSPSILQTTKKLKEHKSRNESSSSSFLTMRKIKWENVPLQKSSTL